NNFSEADNVLKYAEKYQLLNKAEVTNIKNYRFIRKYKLGKIKAVEDFYYKKLRDTKITTKSNIGKISWQVPAQLSY
ncbi:MAG TPA: hypothetical protein VM884_08980, partial [Flavisolibacter sp.]|nr:hypothetical protein [Flavisolibacter sp.]